MLYIYVSDESWVAKLEKDLRVTQKNAFAKGTKKNLKCQWKKFLSFCTSMGRDNLPISTHDLCLYIQFLSRTLKSIDSVRNYVSGLKCLHQLLGFEFPSYDTMSIKLTFKGLDKLSLHVPHQAKPITVKILVQIYNLLDVDTSEHSVIWCLFLFAFLLYSRKCQFVPTSLSEDNLEWLVRRDDIVFENNMLFVTFRKTKTRQSGEGLVVPLAQVPGSCLCPVSAYNNMLRLVPAAPGSPAFILPDGSPIVYKDFHKILRGCLSILGLDAQKFSSHSFRRGGATFSFACGLPSECIQSQGDWRSDAYKLYIDINAKQRVVVAKTLAKFMYYCVH